MNIILEWYFKAMWYVGSPGLLIFIISYALKDYDTIGNKNNDNEIYPEWSNTIGKQNLIDRLSNRVNFETRKHPIFR
jgi:hypothetical protein